jgi:steroid 5-alpha reductase family enzyme
MAGHQTLQIIWGSVILVLMIVHTWCDACFGLHFSNLTNRGIITNGCYRVCKHPAYLIKNIRWWMVSVPFVASQDWTTCLQMSFLLIGVNLVYAWRCWVEERLLSRDPTYIAYGLWMDGHGWMRWVGHIAPFMTYAHRLKRWQETKALKPMPKHYEL